MEEVDAVRRNGGSVGVAGGDASELGGGAAFFQVHQAS